MANYELWLDESGDFVKDLFGEEVPSIVGGLLVEKDKITTERAKKILKERGEIATGLSSKWIHSTDMSREKYGEFAVSVLQDVSDGYSHLVIFENQEHVKIVNSDLTYLHILSEGIIQLFQTLSAQHQEINLNIIAARRVRTYDGYDPENIEIIKANEYIERLGEKIDLGYAKRSIRSKHKAWKWTLELQSARHDPRLMIADVVCHSWFRRDSKKFSDEQRVFMNELFNQMYYFSAVEHSTAASIIKHLSNGNIGEALFEWLMISSDFNTNKLSDHSRLSRDEKLTEEMLQLIIERLKTLPDFARETHLTLVLNQIKILIQLERKFTISRKFLDEINEEIIPSMKENRMNDTAFFFNVNLMLFTNATHQGDIELSDIQMITCRKYLKELIGQWENFSLVLDYYIRESVNLLNRFDYHDVINKMSQLESLLENTIELFPMAMQDDLDININKMNSDVLGKVYGTRLQAYCFLGRTDPYYFEEARADSDRAISQFVHKSDLIRQYQYRAQIECDAGEFTDSLKWLAKSVNMNEINTPNELLENILEDSSSTQVFALMHYSRIIAESALQGKKSLADRLYQGWKDLKIDHFLSDKRVEQHPYEIIFWKIATYMMTTDRVQGGITRYEQAIAICMANQNSKTFNLIQLAIMAEKVYFLSTAGSKYEKECKKSIKGLKQLILNLNEKTLPQSMSDLLKEWEDVFGKKDNKFFKQILILSRKIAY